MQRLCCAQVVISLFNEYPQLKPTACIKPEGRLQPNPVPSATSVSTSCIALQRTFIYRTTHFGTTDEIRNTCKMRSLRLSWTARVFQHCKQLGGHILSSTTQDNRISAKAFVLLRAQHLSPFIMPTPKNGLFAAISMGLLSSQPPHKDESTNVPLVAQ